MSISAKFAKTFAPNQRRSIFVANPTTGVLEVAPEHRDKVVKAIMRVAGKESRRLVFRSRLTQMYLRPLIFLLQSKCGFLRLLCKLFGNL